MAQLEQSTPPAGSTAAENSTRERDFLPAKRNGMLAVSAVLIALAFAAGASIFYQQGQRDAMLGAASSPASATDDAAAVVSTPLIATEDDPASTTTIVQTPSYGKPDIIATVHPTAEQMQAPAAQQKSKTMLAKVTKPARRTPIVAMTPIDRQVAFATRPQLVYPVQALRAREQGTVLVLAQVDVNGHVSDTRIVGHSGSLTLDRAATSQVRSWQFEPALHNGQPIVASVEVPVSYRLDQ